MTDSQFACSEAAYNPTRRDLLALARARNLLDSADACCAALHAVQQAYNALEHFHALILQAAPEDQEADRAHFTALLALVNDAAMKRIDDTWAEVKRARGLGETAPTW